MGMRVVKGGTMGTPCRPLLLMRGRQKNPSLATTVWHHSASLEMPDSDPRDRLVYLPLTSMIDPSIITVRYYCLLAEGDWIHFNP